LNAVSGGIGGGTRGSSDQHNVRCQAVQHNAAIGLNGLIFIGMPGIEKRMGFYP